jgi:hypothetical protein
MQFVPVGMQNRAFGPYLPASHRIRTCDPGPRCGARCLRRVLSESATEPSEAGAMLRCICSEAGSARRFFAALAQALGGDADALLPGGELEGPRGGSRCPCSHGLPFCMRSVSCLAPITLLGTPSFHARVPLGSHRSRGTCVQPGAGHRAAGPTNRGWCSASFTIKVQGKGRGAERGQNHPEVRRGCLARAPRRRGGSS